MAYGEFLNSEVYEIRNVGFLVPKISGPSALTGCPGLWSL